MGAPKLCSVLEGSRRFNRPLGLNHQLLHPLPFVLLASPIFRDSGGPYLRGDFAFIIWDAGRNQLYAARDVLGNRDLAYYADKNICLIASEVAQILASGAREARLHESVVAEWFVGLGDDQLEPLYQDIYYLPPAHYLVATQDHFSITRYWDINPDTRIRYNNDQEYAQHYLELLTTAVTSRLRSFTPVAISLSGELDSTSFAAQVATHQRQVGVTDVRLRTYSYAFNELKECDERRWIGPLVAMYDLDAKEILCDDLWTLRDLNEWPLAPDYILSDSYAWLPDAVAKSAGQDGCRLLIGGDVHPAGNQTVSRITCYRRRVKSVTHGTSGGFVLPRTSQDCQRAL